MEFLHDNMLLNSDLAVMLYEKYAKNAPIIDYHSHLSPREIAEDKAFYNLTELWLGGDHYKWRLMRSCGVSEELITGNAGAEEKFHAFASILPLCIGNPIYIWCHLELKTYFGITAEINAQAADEIFEQTKDMMKGGSYSAQKLILRSNVAALCTTDDPVDSLEYHSQLAASDFSVKVFPTFRPDKILNINLPGFSAYAEQLTGKVKPDLNEILAALKASLDRFCGSGCFVSDHALDNYTYLECSDLEAGRIAAKALSGELVSAEESEKYKTYVLLFLAREYEARGMAMQLHLCCRRNVNSAMFEKLGADSGFDAVERSEQPWKLAKLLDALAAGGSLPKTIVYSLDPGDDKILNTVIQCFQGGGRGRLQHGSAWWFNDTKLGMRAQLQVVSEYSVLGNFIGMLTDSRSFTSYVRHDYFRRILCDHVAEYALSGEYPHGEAGLKRIIENICYANARDYFGLKL